MKKILILFIIVSVFMIAGCTSESAGSDDFPTEPITLILPYGPGGSTDTSARAIQTVISDYLPNEETIIVENVPGGGGSIGLTNILNADADGYTIGMTTIGPISIRPLLEDLEYTHDSFEPVINLFDAPNMLVVADDAPWDTYEEWKEDFTGDDAEPFTYSVGGTVTGGQLAMESINKNEGTKTEAIPYDDGGSAVAAFLGGHTDGYAGFPGNVSGDYKILFNFSEERSEFYPDVPTLKELGVDVGVEFFNGLIAPKGIPEDRLDIIRESFQKAMEDPQVLEELNNLGFEQSYLGPEDFQRVMTETYLSNEEVIGEIDID